MSTHTSIVLFLLVPVNKTHNGIIYPNQMNKKSLL